MLKVLLLIHFIVYAVSPLMVTIAEAGKDDDRLLEQGFTTGKSIHVMLWELIMKKTASHDASSRNQTADTILVTKKRALLPENAIEKLLVPDHSVQPNHHDDSWPPIACYSHGCPPALAGTGKGFQPLLSGHSPPLA